MLTLHIRPSARSPAGTGVERRLTRPGAPDRWRGTLRRADRAAGRYEVLDTHAASESLAAPRNEQQRIASPSGRSADAPAPSHPAAANRDRATPAPVPPPPAAADCRRVTRA